MLTILASLTVWCTAADVRAQGAPADEATDEQAQEAPADEATDEQAQEAPADEATAEQAQGAPADEATAEQAQGAPVDQATDEQKAAARELYVKAKQAVAEQRFEEALEDFRASHAVVASPNSRIMIAQMLETLGRSAEAYAEGEGVLEDANAATAIDPKYQQTADAAQQFLAAIRPSIGMLTVQVPPGAAPSATLTVDGRDIPQDQWNAPIPVSAGQVSVQLSGQPAQEVTVEAGGEASIALNAPADEPEPIGDPEPGEDSGIDFQHKRTVAYVAGGVGAAGFLMFGIFGGLASSAYSDLEDACPTKTACDANLAGDRDDGMTYQTVANVSLVIGIVGIAAGAGFLIWDLVDPGDDAAGDEEDDDVAALRPQLVVGPGSVSIQGSF